MACESGLDDTVTDGVEDESGGLVNIQLLHEPGAMRFGGFYADAKQGGYIFGGFAFGDQLEDLPLAQRQRILPGFLGLGLIGLLDGARHTRAEVDLAARDLADG